MNISKMPCLLRKKRPLCAGTGQCRLGGEEEYAVTLSDSNHKYLPVHPKARVICSMFFEAISIADKNM
jgi:hypothetical protein